LGKTWKEGKIMRIKLIKAFVSILGYKLEDTKVNLPVWQLKKK
jgi:hypothetical protein